MTDATLPELPFRNIRTRLGLTQAEIGDLIGSDRTTVSRYENGKVIPASEKLIKLLNLPLNAQEQAQTLAFFKEHFEIDGFDIRQFPEASAA